MTEMFATRRRLNGVDPLAVELITEDVAENPENAVAKFCVATDWTGQMKSETRVESWQIGGTAKPRDYMIRSDLPPEFLGQNTAPNPQELLMSALNACMVMGYIAAASAEGVAIEAISIETEGEIDLRGFLGLSDEVPNGYKELRQRVTVKADGTREQLQSIHEEVIERSPNYFNLSKAVRVDATLLTDSSVLRDGAVAQRSTACASTVPSGLRAWRWAFTKASLCVQASKASRLAHSEQEMKIVSPPSGAPRSRRKARKPSTSSR